MVKVTECDAFFMSYREPNAETNWSHLKERMPWAKRVDGIKGFDSVHRHCGVASETEFLITIDADTQIRESFLDLQIEVHPNGPKNFCWASRNFVNGLSYGNGGLKLWHKPFASNMAFHEFGKGLDFCWDRDYLTVNYEHSDVFINGSKEQAFRAGYREGVKLTTLRGQVLPLSSWSQLNPYNKRLLEVWCSVGADTENGVYAILGARSGVCDSIEKRVNNALVADFDFIKNRLEKINGSIYKTLKEQENQINSQTPFKVTLLDSTQSAFIKRNYG